MSTTWEISTETKDIVIDNFGNFSEIVNKVKLGQDITEFILFALNDLIGTSGSLLSNKLKIKTKIKEAIEDLINAQRRRLSITPDEERIRSIKNITVETIDSSKTNFSFLVEIEREDRNTITSSGTFNLL